MEVLRTPDHRFDGLPDYPFAPHYADLSDQDGGTLRLHYLDEGPDRRARWSCCSTASRRGATSTGT